MEQDAQRWCVCCRGWLDSASLHHAFGTVGWATAPVPAMAQSDRTKSDGAERPPEAIAFSWWQFPQLPLSAILVTALKIAYTENSVQIRQLVNIGR